MENGLLALGADVRAADPHVVEGPRRQRVVRVDATPQEAAKADAVVLLTDHDAFDLPALAAKAQYFFDARHRVSGPAVEHL